MESSGGRIALKGSWFCRDYQSGDEHHILNLFSDVFDRQMDLAYWRWRFLDSPFGSGIIKLAFDDGKLIGHYAVTPLHVQVAGRLLKGGLAVTAMTHPAYRGKGIFAQLGEEVFAACEQRGVKLVYGFPNSSIYHLHLKEHGWKGFGKLSMLQRDLRKGPARANKAVSICQIDTFDGRVDLLWDRLKNSYQVIVPRTKQFLNWRFVEHPITTYPKITVTDAHDRMLGYLVLKTYDAGDITKGHIVDMLCVNEEHTVTALLSYAYGYLDERGITRLSCWMPDDCFHAQALRDNGFLTEESDTYFGAKILDDMCRDAQHLRDWYITMGDSDVF